MAEKYFPFGSQWTCAQWQAYCPDRGYSKKNAAEFPDWLPVSLLEKWNSAVAIRSGDANHQTFVLQGYRVDEKDNAIDEHHYVAVFDLNAKTCYAGFVEHPSYPDRSTPISPEMRYALAQSGVNADIKLHRAPTEPTGSLQALIDQGIVSGFSKAIAIQDRKDPPASGARYG
jgi:hypothetical protein